MAEQLPGKGLLGWLGRQVGYVRSAIRSNPAVVYRQQQVQEAPHPADPNVTLRRTIIDEAIVQPPRQAGGTDARPAEMADGDSTTGN